MTSPDPSMPSEKDIVRQREIDIHISALRMPLVSGRVNAARRLGNMQAGVDALIDALDDSHESVRAAAAIGLGNFTNCENEVEIIDSLLTAIDDSSEKVCQSAIRSLGMLRAQSARSEIEEFLDDSNPFIVGSAVLSLARLGFVDLGERLASFLHHPSNYVKMQAARAVSILHFTPSGQELLDLLQKTRQEKEITPKELALRASPKRQDDELYSLQNHLIRSIGDLQIEEAAPLLIEIAQKDIGLRGLAVEALVSIGSEMAPELLSGLLADPSAYLRRRLILLMTQFNYKPALPQLRELLREESASIRSAALQAVTEMKDEVSTAHVKWMAFYDPNPFIRVQAVQSLSDLLGNQAGEVFLLLANDSNFQVRRIAISYLLHSVSYSQIDENGPILPCLHQFAQTFPMDEMVPVIRDLLKQLDFQPNLKTIQPSIPEDYFLPPDEKEDIPVLLDLLERWQNFLLESPNSQSDVNFPKTTSALSHLITLLTKTEQKNA